MVDSRELTTIVILLECIRQRLEQEGDAEGARDIGTLLNAVPPKGTPVPKVLLDFIDADEFSDLVARVNDKEFKNQKLQHAFQVIREEEIGKSAIEEVRNFVYKLRNQAIVIRLDVSEARDAFKLFETINNRGLRLSPTDIVKNFLLGNAARFGTSALEEARRGWSDLLRYLDETEFRMHSSDTILCLL